MAKEPKDGGKASSAPQTPDQIAKAERAATAKAKAAQQKAAAEGAKKPREPEEKVTPRLRTEFDAKIRKQMTEKFGYNTISYNRAKVDAATTSAAVAVIAFVAVAREGFETALFLLGAETSGASGVEVVIGGVIGLAIAAIVLLIGMSVDSNVLIFERIREELKLGKTPKGGVRRLALTDLDADARAKLMDWGNKRGFKSYIDPIGNFFVRREGTDPSLPPVMSGSHSDTQPSGGRFDGIYGVLAAFEALEA